MRSARKEIISAACHDGATPPSANLYRGYLYIQYLQRGANYCVLPVYVYIHEVEVRYDHCMKHPDTLGGAQPDVLRGAAAFRIVLYKSTTLPCISAGTLLYS